MKQKPVVGPPRFGPTNLAAPIYLDSSIQLYVSPKDYVALMNSKKKAVLDRIKHLEDAIAKRREYLASGNHEHWQRFRALFVEKARDGITLPPHKDWIRNVFLPRNERALKKAQETLDILTWVLLPAEDSPYKI